MKHVFIINPNAGQGKALGFIRPKIEAYIAEHGLDAEIHVPDSPHAAKSYVHKLAESGERIRFYACGGDGTLFEAVNGAQLHPNAEIAVIPLGSGNDFIRLFGTKEQFLNIDAQVNGRAVPLDLVKCGDQVGINQCSMGLDGEICAKQVAFKKLPGIGGEAAYMAATLYAFLRKMKNDFTIQIDDEPPMKKRVLFCLAANSRWYGGGFKGAPLAIPDDGLLDFIVVEKNKPRLFLLPLINIYKKGEHLPRTDIVTFKRGKKMRIHSDKLAAVNCDGECQYVHDITFEIIEKGINFVVPTTSSYFSDRESGKISQTR